MSDGLEGVVAAETVLSEVDGAAGRLVIRGASLDELAGRARFEDVARLLFDGFFEDLPDAAELGRRLGADRRAPENTGKRCGHSDASNHGIPSSSTQRFRRRPRERRQRSGGHTLGH